MIICPPAVLNQLELHMSLESYLPGSVNYTFEIDTPSTATFESDPCRHCIVSRRNVDLGKLDLHEFAKPKEEITNATILASIERSKQRWAQVS